MAHDARRRQTCEYHEGVVTSRGEGRRGWSWLPKLAVSAALLAFLLSRIPIAEIADSLRAARPWLLAGCLLLTAPIVAMTAWQMQLLLRAAGARLTVLATLRVNVVTEFYAFFLPGYLSGAAVRWYRLTRCGSPPMPTLAALVYNRLVSATVIAASGFVLWLLAPVERGGPAVAWTLAALALALAGLQIVLFERRLAARVRAWAERRSGSRWTGRALRRLAELAAGAGTLAALAPRTRAAVYAICLLRQVVAIAVFYGFAASLSLGIDWTRAGFARAVAILMTLVPISFAGVGVREGGLVLVLTSFGVPAGAAAALSLVLLLRDMLMRLVGGALELRGWLAGGSPTAAERDRLSLAPRDGGGEAARGTRGVSAP